MIEQHRQRVVGAAGEGRGGRESARQRRIVLAYQQQSAPPGDYRSALRRGVVRAVEGHLPGRERAAAPGRAGRWRYRRDDVLRPSLPWRENQGARAGKASVSAIYPVSIFPFAAEALWFYAG